MPTDLANMPFKSFQVGWITSPKTYNKPEMCVPLLRIESGTERGLKRESAKHCQALRSRRSLDSMIQEIPTRFSALKRYGALEEVHDMSAASAEVI